MNEWIVREMMDRELSVPDVNLWNMSKPYLATVLD